MASESIRSVRCLNTLGESYKSGSHQMLILVHFRTACLEELNTVEGDGEACKTSFFGHVPRSWAYTMSALDAYLVELAESEQKHESRCRFGSVGCNERFVCSVEGISWSDLTSLALMRIPPGTKAAM